MSAPQHPTLPPALDAVLDGFEDRLIAARLRAVHRAASTAIESLGYLNLVKYEPNSAEEGPADLDMWEKMASAVADTVAQVSTALAEMRTHFASAFDGREGKEPITEVTDWRASEEIDSVISAINRRLTYELDGVRTHLRRPEVVSSRWRLLSELQEVRAGFRRQLGDLVFLTTNVLAHVQREAVVPGHQSEVSRNVELRRALADFRRVADEQLKGTGLESAKVVEAVGSALTDLADDPAWKLISAEVKRTLIALRDRLGDDKIRTLDVTLIQSELVPVAEKLKGLVDRLTEGLDGHDREVWSECSARLDQVQLHLDLGSKGGARIFAEALEVVESLYGRDPQLDAWWLRTKGLETRRLAEAELREELGRFKEQLQVLPFH